MPPAGLPHTRQPREPVLTSPECYRDGAPSNKSGENSTIGLVVATMTTLMRITLGRQ